MEWHFIVGGAIVGFIVGATGVGGGSLMTPLLTLVFQVPAHVAVGTDLLFAGITKTGGVVAHARRGNIPWQITGWLVAGSVPACIATLLALVWLNPDVPALTQVMKHLLGGALLLTAAGLMLRARVQAWGRRLATDAGTVLSMPTTGALRPAVVAASSARAGMVAAVPTAPVDRMRGEAAQRARPLPTVIVGGVIGTLVTLTSVGAGVIGVVALFFLYPFLETRRIVGADIAHAVPLTLVAGLGHATLGTVDWALLGALLCGSLPAIYVGSAVASRLPERFLRGFLACMLVVISIKLLST